MDYNLANEYIEDLIKDPIFQPKPYSHADWFCKHLIQVLGFSWDDNTPPHFRLRAGNVIVIVSPYPNVVTIDYNFGAFTVEKYFHPSIPQNMDEFTEFWKNLQPLL